MAPFQFSGVKIFLTYPQCALTLDAFVRNCDANLRNVKWIVVGQERHEDGGLHLHAAITFTKRIQTRNANIFDDLAGQPGHYKPMKYPGECVGYCIKDGLFYEHGIDAKAFVKSEEIKKQGKAKAIARRLLRGETIMSIAQDEPGFVMMNLTKLRTFVDWAAVNTHVQKLWKGTDYSEWLACRTTLRISEWLSTNIRCYRRHKQPQLWCYSRQSNLGKTTLLNELRERLHVYTLPDESNMDDYEDGRFDLICADEFEGWHPIYWMNQILDGAPMRLKQRYHSTLKKDNLPVLIMSNSPPEEVYSKAPWARVQNLLTRLVVVEVDQFIVIEYN